MEPLKNSCTALSALEEMLAAGKIIVHTDQGEITAAAESVVNGETNIFYENDFAKITVTVWNKGGSTAYRTLQLVCKRDLVLFDIEFIFSAPKDICEFIFYKTFIHAPTAAFIRCGEYGFYTGIENPFFTAEKRGAEIILSYSPSLLLKAGDVYESEPQFIGKYKCSGDYVYSQPALCLEGMQHKHIRPRFFNPSEEIPLDRAEIQAMREYVYEYFQGLEQNFENILYFYFYPKKQFPQTEEEIHDYLDTIDRFKRLSGSIIAFNPLARTTLPTDEKPYWELCPPNSPAETIYSYAKKQGLKCGFYMGCGNRNEGGNSALLPFAPEKEEWKKKDCFGNTAAENCLGCDEYLDWWYDVQKNTIEKYALGYWAWDPGPGNGNDCYAENHGHIPGKGEYKGWRNSQKLLERIKTRFPQLFLQSFYGRKEYGIWGFRYFSQHEVYWEQTLLFGATLHTDFNDYRINAHGTRLQNLWSMNYRFLPANIGHGLVTRMGEGYYDPSVEKANDLIGWKYSLLSSIACCGSVTHCNLPDKLENVPGITSFYDKWIRWAKENYRFCRYTIPISDNVANRVLDGFARINGDEGQIFLFNSSPLTLRKQLTLNEKIGLTTDKSFYLRILYCENADFENESVHYSRTYKRGDTLECTMPPYGALVLEISDTPGDRAIEKIPSYNHKIDLFYDEENRPLALMNHDAFAEITVTASVRFNRELKDAMSGTAVPNEQFIHENRSVWKKQNLPFNFLSSTPNKITAYIPFAGVEMPEEVQLRINGAEIPVEVFSLRNIPFLHYAFIDEYIQWDKPNQVELNIRGLPKDSFMGIYLIYPDLCSGIHTPQIIMDEHKISCGLHADDTLKISRIEVSPDIIDDTDCEYTITVKTEIPPEKIDAVYCILPTTPRMPALFYNKELQLWQGKFRSGNRRSNIFVHKEVIAWIRSRDGGIGPKKSCEIKTRYVFRTETMKGGEKH